MKKRNVTSSLLAVVSALCLSVVLAQPVAHAAEGPKTEKEIKIDNFSFGPQEITVPVGTTITWTNRDDIPHTIVSTDGVFKSKARDTDEKFSYTFTNPGTYTYFCSLHPKMTGRIIVQ
jgi:plastocyanin